MINEVMKGIAAALRGEFGKDYKIYIDSVEQGFKTPCFFVALVQRRDTTNIGGRYTVSVSLDVQFFPPEVREKDEALHDAAERMEDALEYITLPISKTMLHGKNRYSNTDDGVLHYYVIYETGIYKNLKTDPLMESVEVNGGVKNVN